jgi:hypothetical protein
VQLQVVDGEELIALPQEIFFEEGSEVYLEPSIKDMFNWRDPISGSTYKVHEINDNIGYVIYVMSQHDKCYSILLYTFGSVLGPKHGLGKNTIKNVILKDNLGFCFWMDGL